MTATASHEDHQGHEDHEERCRVLVRGLRAFVSFVDEPWAVRRRPTNWPQFRGNARLTGIAASAPPADAVADAGPTRPAKSIESSPAIADGVGLRRRRRTAICSRSISPSGKLRWKYATGGHHRRIVAGRRRRTRLLRRSRRHRARRQRRGRQPAVDVQDRRRGEVVADARRRPGADRLVRHAPVRARPPHRQGARGSCRPTVRCTRRAGRARRRRLHHRLRRAAARPAADRRRGALHARHSAPTRARRRSSSGGRAYFGTFNYEVLGVDLRAKKIVWRYRNPDREFPFYSSPALADGRVIRRRPRQGVHAIDAATGKAAWTFVTSARVDSSPAIAGGRVYIGSSDGQALRASTRRPAQKQWEYDAGDAHHDVAGHRGGPHRRRRQDGRSTVSGSRRPRS